MRRDKTIKELKKYFQIYELVGPKTYNVHGERAWKFFSTDALECLLITRVGIGKPFTINNWFWGGKFSQRGLRSNVQNMLRQLTKSLKLYLSGHVLGEAFDFDVEGMSAIQVRSWIWENRNKYPCRIRLERNKGGKPINWVHLDTIQELHNPKIYFFNV